MTDTSLSLALGDEGASRAVETCKVCQWSRFHTFLLWFILGWAFFPVWWIAALWGFKKRHTLKGAERTAWFACVALSLVSIILFLIFIIWYGADPEEAKRRLIIGYDSGDKEVSLWTDSVCSGSSLHQRETQSRHARFSMTQALLHCSCVKPCVAERYLTLQTHCNLHSVCC